VVAGFRGW